MIKSNSNRKAAAPVKLGVEQLVQVRGGVLRDRQLEPAKLEFPNIK